MAQGLHYSPPLVAAELRELLPQGYVAGTSFSEIELMQYR